MAPETYRLFFECGHSVEAALEHSFEHRHCPICNPELKDAPHPGLCFNCKHERDLTVVPDEAAITAYWEKIMALSDPNLREEGRLAKDNARLFPQSPRFRFELEACRNEWRRRHQK